MTSQGVGNHRVVAEVEWMKSRLTYDAKVARASLATNRLPENMHTGSHCLPVTAIASYSSGMQNASLASMLASKAEAGHAILILEYLIAITLLHLH